MYAFNNKFYITKDFSETFSSRVKARIGGLKHGGMSYGNGTYSITFDAYTFTTPMHVSVKACDTRQIYVQANATCSES